MSRLNLTVIRSADIHQSAKFYELLGLQFELHSHGKGPKHYATIDSESTFEIYPATDERPVTIGCRIGFEVSSCDEISSSLIEAGFTASIMPTDTAWGRRAVFADPDGHPVEVVSPLENA
ncbi:VOC family protein [Haloferula sp.]|uniref:VOC family protein n=1 Tax=Haloferula sp. TaxID=2497595 RepID=UPI003AF7BD32